MIITGTAGVDNLTGTSGDDTIDALDGSDTVAAGAGNDTIFGGSGNDSLNGELGNDVIHGGDGNDFIDGGSGGDTLFGEGGNDSFPNFGFYAAQSGDGGAGNDSFSAYLQSNSTITTGADSDTINLINVFGQYKLVVTDFAAGSGGDVLGINSVLSGLSGWNGSTNPFAAGFLRLVQNGSNTDLQYDWDGATGGAIWTTFVTLQNVTASSLTSANFAPGYAPNGLQPVGQVITGTAGVDNLTGTSGDDTIDALDGSDTVAAGAGNDTIFGGSGNDSLNGELGNDVIHGGDGNDFIDGGSGGDTLFGEGGNDSFPNFGFYAAQSGDGGAGNDSFSAYLQSNSTITTGADSDTINLINVFGQYKLVVTDFAAGSGGDVLGINSVLSGLSGWNGSTNPFAAGFLRLVQNGSNTDLQYDWDGATGGAIWTTFVTLQNVTASSLTSANFAPGYAPNGLQPVGQVITGTAGVDNLTGTSGDDTIDALDGSDTVAAGAGNDTIFGGSGNDSLNGELGNDVIHGGDGNDFIDGGSGGDTLFGEGGNDSFPNFGFYAAQSGDGGAGNDSFSAYLQSNSTITTGADSDTINLINVFGQYKLVVTDFAAGSGGDVLGINSVLSGLSGWNGSTNPFAAGFLRLVQNGSNTDLQYDWDGATGGAIWTTFVTLQNVTASSLTQENFAPGYPPDGLVPPTITSNGGGNTAALSIAENTTAVTTVAATDPDAGQTLSYSISGGADASKFTIDASTGALSFITAPNFELPTDTGGNNVYDVVVQASDGYGGIDTQAIAVTVTDVSEDGAPGIISGNFSLTAGPDTVVGGAADDTVYATSATLNAGDSLTGGAGTDVLVLVGSGSFSIDQLATFTGFERIRLDNVTLSSANLTLGNQPIEVDASGYLGIQVNSPSNWNGSNIINGDASHTWTTTSLGFNSSWGLVEGVYQQLPIVYDLTSNTFSHVNINGGGNVTLLINNGDTAGIQSFYGMGPNSKLATAGSTLDLSHTTVTGFAVTSTNGLGTAFTVGDLGTAFQIAGGSGQDTIVATGFTFSADQRNSIFATASVEKIVDSSGTYTAPPPSPGVVGLTTGNDTIVGGAADDTVYATSATLNAGDSLTGGAGTDVLVLVGSGSFSIDQLATFTGFERIRLDNVTLSSANLTLGNQPIEVDASGYLGIQVNSPSNWNGSNIINGDASHTWTTTSLGFNSSWGLVEGVYQQLPIVYDLTSNTFSHVNINGGGNVTHLINNGDTAGIQSFYGMGPNSKLATAGSTLDLSHTTVTGFAVTSTNGLGTAFTVGDLGTAFQIAGGSGQDTIVATGFTFSADQRNSIFATASVEKIVDSSGTYNAPLPPPQDSVAPAVTARLNNDTGGLAADNITKDATLTGSGDAGAVVHFTVDGSLIAATATADSNGDWSFTPTGLSDGQHTIVASETDVADNTGTASLTFMLDSVAPAVTARLNNDTGGLATDNITKDATLTGSGDAGAVVHFTVDGSLIAATATADSNGDWSFTPTGLSDGQHTIVASETDVADNTGTASLTFMLDSVAPAVTARLNNDTGGLATDNITKDATLTGSGDAGAVVHFTVDGSLIAATATADSNGDWSFTPTGLSDGQHTIVASETDVADNTGTASLTFMLDSVAPIDVIASVELNKKGSFTFTGTAEANSTVKMYDGSMLLGSTSPDDTGHWKFTTENLASTVHNFTSTAMDVAGNVGQSTGAAIYGTNGSNIIVSSSGSDILTGDGGTDTFVFSGTTFGKDVVTDFAAKGANHDIMEFGHGVFANFADVLGHATEVGKDVVIAYDHNNTVTLVGVHLNQLTAQDFIIV